MPAPLSSTVVSIFDEFLKKLDADKLLGEAARNALSQALHAQELDPAALRAALFMPDEPAK